MLVEDHCALNDSCSAYVAAHIRRGHWHVERTDQRLQSARHRRRSPESGVVIHSNIVREEHESRRGGDFLLAVWRIIANRLRPHHVLSESASPIWARRPRPRGPVRADAPVDARCRPRYACTPLSALATLQTGRSRDFSVYRPGPFLALRPSLWWPTRLESMRPTPECIALLLFGSSMTKQHTLVRKPQRSALVVWRVPEARN